MKNEDLKEIYNKGFKPTFSSFEESLAILNMRDDWEGKSVLEIGCGKGDLCALLKMAGGKAWGIDYSETAISIAKEFHPGTVFEVDDIKTPRVPSDIVVMQGVLEHLDNWWDELKWILDNLCAYNGAVITSSPCFVNPRGYIWQTIQLLFDIKMSLADLHEINPWDMESFCKRHGYHLTTEYSNYDWGSGDKLIIDFRKRLKSEIWKKQFKKSTGRELEDEKVDKFLNWLTNALQAEEFANLGANAIYEIRK